MAPADPAVLAVASEVLARARRAKTEAGRSLKARVASLTMTDSPERIGWARAAADDIAAAGGIDDLQWKVAEGGPAEITVILAED